MLDEARILEICGDHAFAELGMGDEIPAKKLRNAREHIPIPESERVLALMDSTVFGSNKEGMAVCTTGIYWKNDWAVKSAEGYLSWAELLGARVEEDAKLAIVLLGGGNRISTPLVEPRTQLAALLRALQAAVGEQVAASGVVIRPGLRELQRICQGYGGKVLFFVRPGISEKKLANAQECYSVLPSDPVVLLVDTTVFGSAKTGLAVTESGLYWRNASNEDGHEASPLHWDDLAACPPPLNRDADSVEFRPGAFFYAVTSRTRDEVLALARELWDWARASTGINADAPSAVRAAAESAAADAASANASADAKSTDAASPADATEPAAPAAAAASSAASGAPAFPAPPPAPGAAPPPPPAAPAQRWMLARDGQTFGPFDAGTVEAMLRAGQVDPATAFAWTEGMPEWLPFRRVPALALLEPSAAAVAMPPPPPFAGPPPPPPPPGPRATPSPALASPSTDDGRVDVNRATEDELLQLPGITLERARRMMDERARSGGFAGATELGAFLGLAPHEVQALAAEASFGAVASPTPAPQPTTPAPGARVVDF